jgi:hypothetical protein
MQAAPMCFFTWKNKSVIWKAYANIELNKSIIIYVNKTKYKFTLKNYELNDKYKNICPNKFTP